ncbi:hypothetical protein AB1Y20_005912 [Prymnesium parvum]|uniref:Fungal lipase-like domain-containing protein n=1 Tax=Prymnesium parvum TaxID=97485 RepID=A0AB34J348_PRYPA
MAEEAAVLAVFFEGTANSITPVVTQVGMFFEACELVDLSQSSAPAPPAAGFKMGFDGCGHAFGIAGTIWAVGLGTQCAQVVLRVEELLARHRRVSVVVLGLSRGGIAALMLAKRLAEFDGDALSVQLCAFDPVPGNLVCTSRVLDVLRLNAANAVLDCSECHNLRRVLALYPHEPLPDLAFHAPILPRYPASDWCEVEEDAVCGCHQGALYPVASAHRSMRSACKASCLRILTFLSESGVPLREGCCADVEVLKREVLTEYEAELRLDAATYRIAHSSDGSGAILRHRRGILLNKHHRQLVAESSTQDLRKLSEVAADIGPLSTGCGLQRRTKGTSEESEDDGDSGEVRGSHKNVFLLEIQRSTPQRTPSGLIQTTMGLCIIS